MVPPISLMPRPPERSALDRLLDGRADLGDVFGAAPPGASERVLLGIGRFLAARDDGAGMAHAAARRRRGAGNEGCDRLLRLFPRLDEIRGGDLGGTADLA